MYQPPSNLDPKLRIQISQWILDKQLGWIAAADAKVAVVIAVNAATLTALAAFAASKTLSICAIFLLAIPVSFIVAALYCTSKALSPQTDGPQQSIVFFGTIEKMASADYVSTLSSISLRELQKDIGKQIHRNAQIATTKHRWVRRSIDWSFRSAFSSAVVVYLLAHS